MLNKFKLYRTSAGARYQSMNGSFSQGFYVVNHTQTHTHTHKQMRASKISSLEDLCSPNALEKGEKSSYTVL